MDKQYLVPASILGGAIIIAGGLYFGLQGRAAAPAPGADPMSGAAKPPSTAAQIAAPPPSGAVPEQPPSQPGTGGVGLRGLSGQSATPELQAATEKAAKEAVEKLKTEVLVSKCWKPALADKPSPAAAKYKLDVTFNPQGESVTMGINEDRSAERSDVAKCLRETLITVKIPPQGATVRASIPLEFP